MAVALCARPVQQTPRGNMGYTPRDIKSWLDDGKSLEAFARQQGVPLAEVEQTARDFALLDTAVDVDALREHLAHGGSAWSYAQQYGHPVAKVYDVAREEGIDLQRHRSRPEDKTQDILRRYLQGESGSSIGARHGISRQRVDQVVRQHGIARRMKERRRALRQHRTEIVELLREREDPLAIAERFQLPVSWIQRLRREHHVMASDLRRHDREQQRRANEARMERLRVALLQSGHTQNELAQAIGHAPLKVSNTLSATRIRPEIAADITRFLGLDPHWVQTGDPAAAPDWLRGSSLEQVEQMIRTVNANIRLLHSGQGPAGSDDVTLGVRDIMRITGCSRGRAMATLTGRTNGLLIYEKIADDCGVDPAWFLRDHGGPRQPGGARGPALSRDGEDDGRDMDADPAPVSRRRA